MPAPPLSFLSPLLTVPHLSHVLSWTVDSLPSKKRSARAHTPVSEEGRSRVGITTLTASKAHPAEFLKPLRKQKHPKPQTPRANPRHEQANIGDESSQTSWEERAHPGAVAAAVIRARVLALLHLSQRVGLCIRSAEGQQGEATRQDSPACQRVRVYKGTRCRDRLMRSRRNTQVHAHEHAHRHAHAARAARWGRRARATQGLESA